MTDTPQDGYTDADRALAGERNDEAERHAALTEAARLLDAGLISELITDTNSLARSTAALAAELAADRQAREVEVTSLRRRNGIQTIANVLGLLTVLALVAHFGGRLTNVAEENRASLAAQTFSFLDAAFCVAEHGFDDEAAVYTCYEARTRLRLAAQEARDE